MGENVRIFALHQLDIVLGQFEGRLLEVHVPRATRYHETEVNMNYVALSVHQDVIVVPVLNLQ